MDILNEMTKKELLRYIRGSMFCAMHPPKKSDILFWRWEEKSQVLSYKRKANIAYGASLDLAKRDEYAKQFNKSTDQDERLLLLKKMKPYDLKLQKYLNDGKALTKQDEKIDKLYDQIDIERKKEK